MLSIDSKANEIENVENEFIVNYIVRIDKHEIKETNYLIEIEYR